jgi:hypothetical protein
VVVVVFVVVVVVVVVVFVVVVVIVVIVVVVVVVVVVFLGLVVEAVGFVIQVLVGMLRLTCKTGCAQIVRKAEHTHLQHMHAIIYDF